MATLRPVAVEVVPLLEGARDTVGEGNPTMAARSRIVGILFFATVVIDAVLFPVTPLPPFLAVWKRA